MSVDGHPLVVLKSMWVLDYEDEGRWMFRCVGVSEVEGDGEGVRRRGGGWTARDLL